MRPQSTMLVKTLTVLIRIALGLVFLYSSFGKIADPNGFAAIVSNYRLLPQPLVWGTAVLLPWIEATCGLALLCGRFDKGAALLVSLMMAVFIAAILFNGYRGLNIACGCFSLAAGEPSSIALNTMRNLTILAAGLWILFVSGHKRFTLAN